MFKTRRRAISNYFHFFPPPFLSFERTKLIFIAALSHVRLHSFPSDLFPDPLQYIRRATVFYDRPVGEQVLVTICRTRRPPDVRFASEHNSLSLSFSVFRCMPGRGRTIKFVCPLKHNACCVRSSARPKKNSIYRTIALDGSLFRDSNIARVAVRVFKKSSTHRESEINELEMKFKLKTSPMERSFKRF